VSVNARAGPTPIHGQQPVGAGALVPSVSNMAVLLKKEKCWIVLQNFAKRGNLSQWWDTTRRRLVSCAVCLEECWDLFRPLAINSAAAADCGSRDYGFHFLWRVIIGVSRNCVSVLSGNNTDYYCLLCLWIT